MWVLGIILGVYLGTVAVLNIPYVQRKMVVWVAGKLSTALETEVSIRRINPGFLNRIIIDDLAINDRSGKPMVKVTRLSAKYNILSLMKGKISISNMQFFGFDIDINKADPQAESNFRFIIDALASNDSTSKDSKLDLRINSLLIRRGQFTYNVLSEEETPGILNPGHIKLYNIIGNISLKALKNDSINMQVKRLSVDEQSGFELQKLSFKLHGNDKGMTIEDFGIDLPGTSLAMDTIRVMYDSLNAIKDITTDVRFNFRLLPASHITLQDLSPFVPVFSNFRDKIDISLMAEGSIDQLNCPVVAVNAADHVRLRGSISFQGLSNPKDAFIYGNLSNLSADTLGIEFIARNFSREGEKMPQVLYRMGNLSFNGEISGYFTDLVMYGYFRTSLGLIKGDVKLSSDKEREIVSYSGGVKTEGFLLGPLLADDKWGNTTFNMKVESSFRKNSYPHVVIDGLIESVEYSGYTYRNITLDGEYKNGGFDGKAALDDENGAVTLNGSINISREIPTFNFTAGVRNLRPHRLNLSEKFEEAEFSVKINADFTGNPLKQMIGSVVIDSFLYTAPDRKYYMDNMKILSVVAGDKRRLTVNSGFLNAEVEGNYSYEELPGTLTRITRNYLPSVFPPGRNERKEGAVYPENNFTFHISVYNTEILPIIFDIPLSIYSPSTIKGFINDDTNRMRLEAHFPKLSYGKSFIESGLIIFENPDDLLHAKVRLSNYKRGGIINVSFDTTAEDDALKAQLHWGNNAEVTYSGQLKALANFSRRGEGRESHLQTNVDIQPTNVILNDTIWQVHPSTVTFDSGIVRINDFNFSRGDQYLRINGCLSDSIQHTAKVDLKDISLEYVFSIFNLRNVDFKGLATGYAQINRAFDKPVMNADLFVRDFSFNNGILGDLKIRGEWDDKEEGILLSAAIAEQDSVNTNVNGYIYPLRPKSGLDLHFDATRTNIKFVEHYIDAIASDVKGRAAGKVRLHGGFSSLNLEGALRTDASFKVNILNTAFSVNDVITFTRNEIQFNNTAITDPEKHKGTVNGYIRHTNFDDITYRMQINANNLLAMNTVESPDLPFYGVAYGTGNVTLSGNEQGLSVNAAMTTNRNTNFVYSYAPAASAVGNQFIQFTDKTLVRNLNDTVPLLSDFERARRIRSREKTDEPEMDVRLNIQIDATPDATVRIIMDPVAGDYISGRGSGNIRAEYFNKGDVRMFGSYRISQGIYKFSLQEVIRKDFIIQGGSGIEFNGNPMTANLDVRAVYTVNSASLRDLGLNTEERSPNVRANCIMDLSGALDAPNIKLSIELPNESDELRAQVRNVISTNEDINMQFLYLLAIGKFYTPDYISADQNSNMMTSVVSSTLSGQLNNLISQVFNSSNWNLGTNLSTGDQGWTDMEIEGVLSAQLLNNRLLINGNFGYRDNPYANTNFVGDFDAEWLLTPSGDIRLKAYNQTNNRLVLRNSLSTQGVGIVFRRDFARWNELFVRKRRTTTRVVPEAGVQPTDSIPINTLDNNKLKTEENGL